MIWLTSDLHIFHGNIIRYCNRNYASVNEMNEALIKNWNAVVSPEDIVWNLGDFAFCSYDQFIKLLSRLNGKINVILGNHDKVIVKNKDRLLSSHRLESIQHYAEIYYEKQLFILFHYAMRIWNHRHHGSILLYGHSHGTLPPIGKSVDVGIDCKEITSEYRPVSIEEVIKYMNTRPVKEPKEPQNEQHMLRNNVQPVMQTWQDVANLLTENPNATPAECLDAYRIDCEADGNALESVRTERNNALLELDIMRKLIQGKN